MKKIKIKKVLLIVAICIVVGIFFKYLNYYLFYDGYLSSDMNTGDCITYAVEQILLSDNSLEKKKEMIENICSYSNSEITIENVSNKTMLYQHASGFINKKLFKEFPLMGKLIKTKNGDYSIEYKTYVPKFYIAVTRCIYLGKHMTRI